MGGRLVGNRSRGLGTHLREGALGKDTIGGFLLDFWNLYKRIKGDAECF